MFVININCYFLCSLHLLHGLIGDTSNHSFIYRLETVVSVLFSNTRTRLLYKYEREIFNTARSKAECSIENFESIVQ